MQKTAVFLKERPFILFLLLLLFVYLPVFLPLFHIKNDLVTQNLPTRFVIGESLYSGYFPWWNPYINFGIPQYGDMNGGYWNPLLWLIARTTGYGIWAITLEEMFYILMGAWGIFLLCRELNASKETSFITGLSYMCCGYILGHLQHFCWITGTATFPYVLLYFVRSHRSPLLKNFIGGGLSVFFFVASTHPGLIIGAIYFFGFLIAAIYFLRKEGFGTLYHPKFWLSNLLFLAVSLLFSLVVIISDMDVLKNISRGSKVSLEQSLLHPTTFSSYLSLLFPLAVQKSDGFHAELFPTDIAMRNTYIGILLLFCFLLFCMKMKRKVVLATSCVLLFFVLLSSGGLFKTFAWHYLPYTGYVRLNGEFNYFVLLILILAGAIGLERYFKNPSYEKEINKLWYLLNGIGVAGLLISACLVVSGHSLLFQGQGFSGQGAKERIKWIIDHIGFADLLFLQSLIQLITIACIRRFRSDRYTLFIVTVINFVIISWLVLPFTGLGMASKANRQELITHFPKGIHAPEQVPLSETVYLDSAYTRDLILLGSYSKKIGYVKEEVYPVELMNTERFFTIPGLFPFIRQQSYIFLSKDTLLGTPTRFDSAAIRIGEFGPGHLQASVNNQDGYRYLTLLQNDYPYWKVRVNGQAIPHFTGFGAFITIPVQQGRQQVEFYFDPRPVRIALYIQLLIFTLGICLLLNSRTRNLSIFKY